MVGAALLMVLAGCSGGPPNANDCTRAFHATCDHQLSCELAFDFQACVIELQEQFVCDYSKTKDEFKACAAAESTPCAQFMDETCFEVLCAKSIGCIETSVADTGAEQ